MSYNIQQCIDGWRGEGFDEMADDAKVELAALRKVAEAVRMERMLARKLGTDLPEFLGDALDELDRVTK